jgi:8-oxo-dGTP pyrophosphatase MutT (NUDIX family)
VTPRDLAAPWPVVATPQRTRGTFVTLRTDRVRMPDGEVVARDVLEHPGAVAIVALDERDAVLMIRQYRHPAGGLLWEIPAGLRDVAGEPARQTAERELREETGYLARDWLVLADYYPSPGISTEMVRVFLARGLSPAPPADQAAPLRHEEAHLIRAWVPLQAVVGHILAGDLHNGLTAVGIFAAYAARQGGFAALRDADAPGL